MKPTSTTFALVVALASLGACGESTPSTDSGAIHPAASSTDGAEPDASANRAPSSPPPPPPPTGTPPPLSDVVDAGAPDAAPASTGGDAGAGLANVRLDELQVTGTHNSYHLAPAVAFDDSHKYSHKPLDQQLEGGVRTLELDLHKGLSGALEIYHLPVIDPNVTCGTLDDCLTVIERWSSAHPRHTPIFVWFEVKDDVGGLPISNLDGVDDGAKRIFGESRIVTPAFLKGAHASPRARLEADGWPRLDELRGKVMFVLLNDDDGHSDEYTHGYTSLDGRVMFASASPSRFTQPWAVVAKFGPTDQALVASARAAHLLTCANVCSINTSDSECTARLAAATSLGIHMLQDDLPFAIPGRSYHLALPHGSPGCNPVSATSACDPARLE